MLSQLEFVALNMQFKINIQTFRSWYEYLKCITVHEQLLYEFHGVYMQLFY